MLLVPHLTANSQPPGTLLDGRQCNMRMTLLRYTGGASLKLLSPYWMVGNSEWSHCARGGLASPRLLSLYWTVGSYVMLPTCLY